MNVTRNARKRSTWATWSAPLDRRRCEALDVNGKRCRRRATWRGPYHGDGECLREDGPKWVVVHLCNDHASGVR